MDRFAGEFNKQLKGKKDVRDFPKAIAKLRKSAEKIKKVLSASKDYPVRVESLLDDKDFKSQISRQQLEELGADMFERVSDPIQRALDEAKLTVDDIDGIEILGGGVRVPRVKEELTKFFGEKELGNHLNGDEAMALGAAFRAANISTAFRVRKVGMTDISPFPMGVRLTEIRPAADNATATDGAEGDKKEAGDDKDGDEAETKLWSKRAALFKKNDRLASRKMVTFKHDTDFSCTFLYDAPSKLPVGTGNRVATYNVLGVRDVVEGPKGHLGKPKIQLSFFLNANGIMQIVKAEAILEETIIVNTTVPATNASASEDNTTASNASTSNASNSTEDGDDADKKEEKEDDADEKKEKEKKEDDADEKKEKKEGEEEEGDSNSTETKNKSGNASSTPATVVKKEKKKIHRIPLKVRRAGADSDGDLTIRPMAGSEKKASRKVLEDISKADAERRALEVSRNELEAFVLATRRFVSDDEEVTKVTTEEQREKFVEDLTAAEDWLYEDESADLKAVKSKLGDLKARSDDISFRIKEVKQRPKAVAALRKILEATAKQLEDWVVERPQITEADRTDIAEALNRTTTWIDEKEAEQDKIEAHEAAAFTSRDVSHQVRRRKGSGAGRRRRLVHTKIQCGSLRRRRELGCLLPPSAGITCASCTLLTEVAVVVVVVVVVAARASARARDQGTSQAASSAGTPEAGQTEEEGQG